MKQISLEKFTILFLSFFIVLNLFTIQQTKAQDGLYKKSTILAAYADNYHPKINEPVKITIHFTSPGDFEKGTFNLGFQNGSEFEIISGDNLYQKSLSKGQNVDMTIYVKFIEKKLCYLDIRFFKNNKVLLTFYVGGAFRESEQVENLNSDLERLKQAIENYKNNQTQIPKDLLYSARHYKYSQNQTILTRNEYEKSIIKELEKKNKELFNTLKQEIDSLTEEAKKLYKSFEKQKSLPPPPPEGEPQEPIWQKQERESTSTVLNVSKISAIKNHKARYIYFLKNSTNGQKIPLPNILTCCH